MDESAIKRQKGNCRVKAIQPNDREVLQPALEERHTHRQRIEAIASLALTRVGITDLIRLNVMRAEAELLFVSLAATTVSGFVL